MSAPFALTDDDLVQLDAAAQAAVADADARAAAREQRRWKAALWLAGLCVAASFAAAGLRVRSDVAQGGPPAARIPLGEPQKPSPAWEAAYNATFAAARAADPSLPDPASVTFDDADTVAPVALSTLGEQAYVGQPAPAFVMTGATLIDRVRAQQCLTTALYYEAASETDDGMRGVAQVILNRVRHPSFPSNVCGVVYQGSQRPMVCQFTFACDGSLARTPAAGPWNRAERIAREALSGRVFPSVGVATHYHTTAIWPKWGRSLAMTNVIGAHIFHRWRGRWGEPQAFTQRYGGREPVPGPYLPLAAQLAAKAGGAANGDGVTAVTSNTDPVPGSALPPGGLRGPTMPVSAGTDTRLPPAPSLPMTSPVAAPPPPPTAKPGVLDQSGGVKENWRDSGTWKDRKTP